MCDKSYIVFLNLSVVTIPVALPSACAHASRLETLFSGTWYPRNCIFSCLSRLVFCCICIFHSCLAVFVFSILAEQHNLRPLHLHLYSRNCISVLSFHTFFLLYLYFTYLSCCICICICICAPAEQHNLQPLPLHSLPLSRSFPSPGTYVIFCKGWH